jgi:hypothetical protein
LLLVLITVDGYNRNLVSRSGGLPRIRRPPFIRAIIEVPQLIQDWHMFAPDPSRSSGYWMAVGIGHGGSEIDPLTGRDPRGLGQDEQSLRSINTLRRSEMKASTRSRSSCSSGSVEHSPLHQPSTASRAQS